MFIYWLLFLLPVVFFLSPIYGDKGTNNLVWTCSALALIVIIGLRFDVGGDWPHYLLYIDEYDKNDFLDVFYENKREPGYQALNYLASKLDFGIGLVNTFSAAFFTLGLVKFCRMQPYPWLALAIATPYLVIVVAMGYTRQSIAIGFVLWALSIYSTNKRAHFILLILVGALFHTPVVVMLPFAFSDLIIRNIIKIVLVLALFLLMFLNFDFIQNYQNFLLDPSNARLASYLVGYQQSAGAIPRLLMTILPIIISLFFYKQMRIFGSDVNLYHCMSFFIITIFPLSFIVSTLVDRIALYFIPLQIALWTRLVFVQRYPVFRACFGLLVILIYSASLFIWLNYASNRGSWLPYDMLIFKQ